MSNDCKLDDESLSKIQKKTKKAFEGVSVNSKQKLVYNLLNTAKSQDTKRFFDTLLRALNSNMGSNSDRKEQFSLLAREIESYYSKLYISKNFDKFSHSIILGIMASENKTNGGDSNE